MLNINLEYDPNAAAAPQSFRNAVQLAANELEAVVTDNITVNIAVGYGEIGYGGTQYTTISAGGLGGINPATVVRLSYPNILATLQSNETSAADVTAVASLPATSSLNGQTSFFLSGAQAKAFGLTSATSTAVDGYAGFATNLSGNTLTGVAIVELVHALGLANGGGLLSLFQYTSAGTQFVATGAQSSTPAYFSVDGGKTSLASYDVQDDDTLFNVPGDALSYGLNSTVFSSLDLTELNVIGFTDQASASGQAAVDSVYQAVLGRNPTSSELSGWLNSLGNGGSFVSIAATLAASSEAQGHIDALYVSVLGRHADPSGLSSTTNYLASGGSLTGVAAELASSSEAQNDLTTLYQQILGRAADAGGLASFTNYLATGGTLTGVTSALAQSAEAQNAINALYLSSLGRPVDPFGLASFTGYLAAGGTLAGVSAALQNSTEALALDQHPSGPNATTGINANYISVLGRAADGGGLVNAESVLGQSGASLLTVRAFLANSPEAKADIQSLYLSVLGRAADPAGLAAYQTALAQPIVSLAAVRTDLANSAEAAAAINTLYLQVLGRAADPIGLAWAQAALGQPGGSLTAVRQALATSVEAATDIGNAYQAVLGRSADPGGLAAFQAMLMQPGGSIANVRAGLAASSEAQADIGALYQNVLGRNADAGGLAAFQQLLTNPTQSLGTIRSDLVSSAEATGDIRAVYAQYGDTASTSVGVNQLNAGLSLSDFKFQTSILDGPHTLVNIAANSTTSALANAPELIQALTTVGASTLNNFISNLDVISVFQTSFQSLLNGSQQAPAGLQLGLGSAGTLLLTGINEATLSPKNFYFLGQS